MSYYSKIVVGIYPSSVPLYLVSVMSDPETMPGTIAQGRNAPSMRLQSIAGQHANTFTPRGNN